MSTMLAMRTIYALRQQVGETLESYYRRFQATVNTAEMLDALVADHPGIVKWNRQQVQRRTKRV